MTARRRRFRWGPALLVLALLPAAPGLPLVSAEVASEARTPAEVFERKSRVEECLVYVARDLKARWEADRKQEPAELLLVIDPTTSMADEIKALQAALPKAWEEGPAGLLIGVYGLKVDEFQAPSRIPNDADSALAALAFLPADGPKNIHAGLRAAAERAAEGGGGPRAMLFVSQECVGAEDDVEATREAVIGAGASFYCMLSESGFERAWVQEYKARNYPSLDLTERYNPIPKKRHKNALYYGSDVAFGLIPYGWEFDLAQSDFVWVRPPRYPVPSGFGYWSMATLCFTSGGRYFVYDFTLPANHPSRQPVEADQSDAAKKKAARGTRWQQRRKTTYDYSRMALVAPDLRPRQKILKDLSKDWRAMTIIRIWDHLADDAVPVLQKIGALERRSGGLSTRPERPVRSSPPPLTWFEDLDDVRKATSFIKRRLTAVETALKWWESANGKERTGKPGQNPLKERIEADFQLLGVQLRKVRFHLNEAIAALKSIKSLDVTYRRARILPRPIVNGIEMPGRGVDLKDEERNARFAEVFLAQARVAERYPDTPWSAVLKKGWMLTFVKDVQVIQTEREVRRRKPDPKDGDGSGKGKGKDGKKPPPKPTPRPPPPPGPRPGSGSGGPVTGK
jgi:hypothetical protein